MEAGLPSSPQLGTLGSPRTYTYTDAELQSLLTCVLDEGHAGHLEGLALPMGGGHGPAGGHSLQFLPHLPMPTSVTSSEHEPAMFIPSDFAGPQAMGGDAAHLAAPLGLPPLRVGQQAQGHPHMNGGSLELDPLGSRSSTFTMAGAPGAAPAAQQRQQARQSQRPGPRAGPAGAARASSLPVPAAAAKQPHSIVEKQRRDRINHLIDELRDLVPPQGTAAELGAAMAAEAAAAGDSRRPKHVVLSDTIRLIKDLQLQVAEMQVSPPAEGARAWHEHQMVTETFNNSHLQPPAAPPNPQPSAPPAPAPPQQEAAAQQETVGMEVQAAAQQAASGSFLSGDGPHPELPHAPDDDAASDSGVVVESEAGQIRYVKVTCPDRHGLLADVVRALRELPLEITTAAITTRRDHVVYDVFQVEVEDPALTQEQLRAAVEAALHPAGEKKRKQECQQSPCTALLAG